MDLLVVYQLDAIGDVFGVANLLQSRTAVNALYTGDFPAVGDAYQGQL